MTVPKDTIAASRAPQLRQGGEIRSLTGLRGVTAMFVIIYHATGYMGFSPPLKAMIEHGYVAVDLFFILSGFVMAMTAGHFFQQSFSWQAFGRFIGLRLARVWPLYAFMSIVCALLIAFVFDKTYFSEDVARALLPNLTMTQGWGLANSLNRPGWSISTEWAAYLLFPLLCYSALRSSLRMALMSLGACLGLFWLLGYGPEWFGQQKARGGPIDIASSYASGSILRCLAGFYLGLLVYRFRHIIAKDRSAPWAVIIVCFIVACLFWRASDFLLMMLFASLILALHHDYGLVARFLGTQTIWLLGQWSYAIYLIHDPLLRLIFRHLPKWLAGVSFTKPFLLILSLILTLILAYFAHHFIEKPSRSYLKKHIDRLFPLKN